MSSEDHTQKANISLPASSSVSLDPSPSAEAPTPCKDIESVVTHPLMTYVALYLHDLTLVHQSLHMPSGWGVLPALHLCLRFHPLSLQTRTPTLWMMGWGPSETALFSLVFKGHCA